TPNGKFTFLNAFQPDGIPSLDMNLYEENKENEIVSRVYLVKYCNNQYVGIKKDMLFVNRNNRYYMMTSHLTGWAPNAAELFINNHDSLDKAE
ncbi:unnamed protein product, partial [Rotaria sp. Silwood1]